MGRRHGDMGVLDRAGVQPGRDQARGVGDVGEEDRLDVVGDGAETREVDRPTVGARPGDDRLRPYLPARTAIAS